MKIGYTLKTVPEELINRTKEDQIKDADLLNKLLHLRNIDESAKANFLKPDFETGFHDPFLLKDMDKVVKRILQAIDNNEQILIYSDFDADGLPGSAVIQDFFKKISYNNVLFFRPNRHNEGFGVHSHILEEERFKNISLLITIDCGIADVKAFKEISANFSLRGKKLDIIVTDHHLPGPELPNVFAIINPKQSDCVYPEKMLCGAAVIYKVVCALVKKINENLNNSSSNSTGYSFSRFPLGYEKWLLDLVGLSTLSDMVPLIGENRLLAYYGLIVMKKTRRPGFLALAKTNMIDLRNITEDDIVFTFSPRINVASRLADAQIAFDLLTTDSYDKAFELAKELNSINTRRKTLVATMTKQANKLIKDKELNNRSVIVIGNPDWKPPVLGLVATSLVKSYKKPVFIWGRSEDEQYKGSVRGYGGIDITKIMHHMEDEIFTNRGGHAEAGGFTIVSERVFDFEQTINQAFDDLYGAKTENVEHDIEGEINHEVDAVLPLSAIKLITFQDIEKLSPYGMANPKPTFAFCDCTVTKASMFGKQKDHLEIMATDDSLDNLKTIKGIQFFYEGNDIEKFNDILDNKKFTLIGHIEKNQFRGASDIRLRLIDIY